jgi:hypothetical protein
MSGSGLANMFLVLPTLHCGWESFVEASDAAFLVQHIRLISVHTDLMQQHVLYTHITPTTMTLVPRSTLRQAQQIKVTLLLTSTG